MQMGFPSNRVEKAIAATGNKGVQLASDWLLSHVSDPTLDTHIPRDYILYLCPVGELQHELLKFYHESLQQCGWNKAHDYFPHITMCRFFKADDKDVAKLEQALQNLAQRNYTLTTPLSLERSFNKGFLFLSVKENCSDLLKRITDDFAAEVNKLTGVHVEPPQVAPLHVSLAYSFPREQQPSLETLACAIKLDGVTRWDLRLYSRDPRVVDKEVMQVLYPYTPHAHDEHELIQGDYIFVDKANLEDSGDGWPRGLSWLTGTEGHFPLNYTEKTAPTETWTMHRAIPLSSTTSPLVPSVENEGASVTNDTSDIPVYAKIDKSKKKNKAAHHPRQLYVVRHGERVDFTFGKDWIETYFDKAGNYLRLNLNLPKVLPTRQGGHKCFHRDSPLTELGLYEAFLTGEAMKEKGVKIDYVYTSPSLRCVQTASQIMKGLGQTDKQLRLEEGLFEWLGWYRAGMPKWMTTQELRQFNLNVDTHYKSVFPTSRYNRDEDTNEYYQRCHSVTTEILKQHENGEGIILVGHAGSVDVCTRQLLGKPPRPRTIFRNIVNKMAYCGIAKCAEDNVNQNKWHMVDPEISSFTHTDNKPYSWKIWL